MYNLLSLLATSFLELRTGGRRRKITRMKFGTAISRGTGAGGHGES